jgi:CTP-dependent riboflavin kinase
MAAGDLSGTVVPGRGLGSALMRDSRVTRRFEEIAGFQLVPGTLNVRLQGPLVRDGLGLADGDPIAVSLRD